MILHRKALKQDIEKWLKVLARLQNLEYPLLVKVLHGNT